MTYPKFLIASVLIFNSMLSNAKSFELENDLNNSLF